MILHFDSIDHMARERVQERRSEAEAARLVRALRSAGTPWRRPGHRTSDPPVRVASAESRDSADWSECCGLTVGGTV